MNDRSENMMSGRVDKSSNSLRKNKKRGNKKINPRIDNWCGEEENNLNGGQIPGMDYGQMFWQQPSSIPPHMQSGQRLFQTMSDPSVCGYSAVPMAYTMEPVSMPPIYPLYRPVPQPSYRAFRGKPRRNITQNNSTILNQNQSNIVANGYLSLQENRSNYLTPTIYQNGDYASLPPSANNDTENDGDELNSEHRRYSDPGLGPADLKSSYTNSDDSDSGDSSIITIGKNNKLVLSLVEQMTSLREANSRMFKDLHETKLSLETVKAELSRVQHQTSSDYQPGMLSDIISEIREANKIMDESMMTKVTAIVEERNQQILMELEGVKERLKILNQEKTEDTRKISLLEEEVARLTMNSNNEGREIAAFEEETLALRRELQEARSTRQLAENHAIKCVDEVIKNKITPVTFNPPRVTSTPVRTEIQKSSSHESADSLTSLSCSELSDSPIPNLSPSNSSRNMEEENYGDVVDLDWQWKNFNHDTRKTNEEEEEEDGEDEEEEEEDNNNKKLIKINNSEGRKESIKSMEPDEIEALERLINFHLEREQSIALQQKQQQTTDNKKNEILENGRRHSQRSCCSTTSSRSTASSSESEIERITRIVKKNNNIAPKKIRRKYGIVDVPDVIVVAGKSVVPNDLRSTSILTSRVLTAPSRATYTTAYI